MSYYAGLKTSELRQGVGPTDHHLADDYYVYLGLREEGGKKLGRYFVESQGWKHYWPPVVDQLARKMKCGEKITLTNLEVIFLKPDQSIGEE